MACPISRSGNYQPELSREQAIFPDREFLVPIGDKQQKISRTVKLQTKKTPRPRISKRDRGV
jgi:hypothetical protein